MPRQFVISILCVGLLLLSEPAGAQLTPQDAIGQMGRGINIGNTLEPPTESAWNNGPLQEYYFDDYVTAGFSTVRIPVRWDQHTSSTAPFEVDASWMNRVEQVVEWGLAGDLFIIINGHHEDWLKQNYSNATIRARYDSIWSQVALRFRDKSEKLFFEIINEPYGMTVGQVDDLNARILQIIRRSNPTRIVIFSGNEYSNSSQLLRAAIPNDPYLMGYFHSYDPWDFAGLAQGTWGTSADRQVLASKFQSVANWSATHNIPVMISEFGAIRTADFNSRMRHYAAYVEESVKNGFAFQAWDDGGDFQIYLRDEREWNEVKDILIHAYPDGPTQLATSVEGDSILTLTWTNRSSAYPTLYVERRVGDAAWVPIAEVSGGTSAYGDSTVSGGQTYLYRLIARSGLTDDRYSYPIRVTVAPTRRSNFLGAPFVIPGTIEAEDYDVGGEGLTYHDADAVNVSGAYRPNEGVDIESRDDGGFQVAYVESGEWLEYTIQVEEDADYRITAYVASLDGGGRFRFEFGSRFTRGLTVPATNSWQTLAAVSTTIPLSAGEQIVRVNITDALPFNLDRYVTEKVATTSVETVPGESAISVYPNPTQSDLHVSFGDPSGYARRVELFNVLGQLVRTVEVRSDRTTLGLDGLPSGVYVIRVLSGGEVTGQRIVVKR